MVKFLLLKVVFVSGCSLLFTLFLFVDDIDPGSMWFVGVLHSLVRKMAFLFVQGIKNSSSDESI